MNEELLTVERVGLTIAFHKKLQAEVKAKIDQLAIKMGVDPDKDILAIPAAWCEREGWDVADFPKWMMKTSGRQGKIIQGVRER